MRSDLTKTQKYPGTIILCFLLFTACVVHTQGQERSPNETRYKELPNFGRVNERLFRGGQPGKGGIRKLAELGVKTIINLRDDDPNAVAEAEEAKAAGLRYFNIPFKRVGRPSDSQIDQVLSLINEPENGIVFVHCHHGWDRTGTVIAVYRISHDGWTDDKAKQEAERFGMKFWQWEMKDYISDYFRDKSPRSTTSKKPSP